MSWDIYMYAEVKKSGCDKWEPLMQDALSDGFKYLNDGFIDTLPTMKASETEHPSIISMNDAVYLHDFAVKYCSIKELQQHFEHVIDQFNIQIKLVYSALGLNIDNDDDDYIQLDDYYEDSCSKCQSLFDKMTYPVNKELLITLASMCSACQKANRVLGICNVIYNMCSEDDEIRLLFATL